jgi:hypothetical protein
MAGFFTVTLPPQFSDLQSIAYRHDLGQLDQPPIRLSQLVRMCLLGLPFTSIYHAV